MSKSSTFKVTLKFPRSMHSCGFLPHSSHSHLILASTFLGPVPTWETHNTANKVFGKRILVQSYEIPSQIHLSFKQVEFFPPAPVGVGLRPKIMLPIKILLQLLTTLKLTLHKSMLLSLNTNVIQRQGEILLLEPGCTVRNIKWEKQKCHLPPRKTDLQKVGTQDTLMKSLLQQKGPLEKKITRT